MLTFLWGDWTKGERMDIFVFLDTDNSNNLLPSGGCQVGFLQSKSLCVYWCTWDLYYSHKFYFSITPEIASNTEILNWGISFWSQWFSFSSHKALPLFSLASLFLYLPFLLVQLRQLSLDRPDCKLYMTSLHLQLLFLSPAQATYGQHLYLSACLRETALLDHAPGW